MTKGACDCNGQEFGLLTTIAHSSDSDVTVLAWQKKSVFSVPEQGVLGNHNDRENVLNTHGVTWNKVRGGKPYIEMVIGGVTNNSMRCTEKSAFSSICSSYLLQPV